MSILKIKNEMNLCHDLINIFTDYAFGLDEFFKFEQNQNEHDYLYKEYLILNENIKKSIKRNGFDK